MNLSPTDILAGAIVLGGTLLGTILRCGFGDFGTMLEALAGVFSRHFDADTVRASLAVQIQQIRRDGLLRASPRPMGDAEFEAATDALIGHRSIDAMIATHEEHKAARVRHAAAAAETLWQAAELAPVFGLAGTLVSLSLLPANGIERSAFLVAIGMAVHATLYGLVVANLVLSPLARLVERRAAAEEAERQQVLDWLATQLAEAAPRHPVHAPSSSHGHGHGQVPRVRALPGEAA